MTLLLLGLLVWSGMHFMPILAPGVKESLQRSVGEGKYRGVFSATIILSLVLIVFGWRSADYVQVYQIGAWGYTVTPIAVFVALLLFAASAKATNIKRYIRHPQLMSIIVWGAGHLFSNGDLRSVLLFGGMSLWAALMMLLINRRDGAWQKPEVMAWSKELPLLVIAVVAWVIIALGHRWVIGVSPFPTI